MRGLSFLLPFSCSLIAASALVRAEAGMAGSGGASLHSPDSQQRPLLPQVSSPRPTSPGPGPARSVSSNGTAFSASAGASNPETPGLPLTDPVPADAASVSAQLPLKLPGYELRVLHDRKPILVDVDGTKVELRLPVFFYLPNPVREQAVHLLHDTADELRHAAHQPSWSETNLEQLARQLEEGLALLRAP